MVGLLCCSFPRRLKLNCQLNCLAHAQGELLETITLQMGMVGQLRHMAVELRATRGTAAKKAERLRAMVSPGGQCGDLASLRVACPLDPNVTLAGTVAEECSVFKSTLAPLRLSFHTQGEMRTRQPQGHPLSPVTNLLRGASGAVDI